MSRIVYFDCASGAAGDMLLGALLDLGLPLDALRAELAKLPLTGYRLESHRVHRAGLHATKVEVVVGDGHALGDAHAHAHPHRRLPEIVDLIGRRGLEPAIRDKSSALFRRLAEAEG